jgi:hypothetical protein
MMLISAHEWVVVVVQVGDAYAAVQFAPLLTLLLTVSIIRIIANSLC